MSGRLFLYGTLLPGLVRPPLAALIARLTPLGPARVPGRLYDLGPYPALVPDQEHRVLGELFALPADPAVLAALDEYEGCAGTGGLYRRVECVATTADGRELAAWVYAYNGDVSGAVLIAHGDYRRWCQRG